MLSLNSLNSVIALVLEPTTSRVRDRDSTTVPQTKLSEKTVKLNLIHASVIY